MERVGETEMVEDINEQKQLLLWHVDFIVDCLRLKLWNFLEASQLVLLDTRQQKALVVFGQNHGAFYHKWLQGIDCGPVPLSKLTLPIMLTLPQEPLDALLSEVPTDHASCWKKPDDKSNHVLATGAEIGRTLSVLAPGETTYPEKD